MQSTSELADQFAPQQPLRSIVVIQRHQAQEVLKRPSIRLYYLFGETYTSTFHYKKWFAASGPTFVGTEIPPYMV